VITDGTTELDHELRDRNIDLIIGRVPGPIVDQDVDTEILFDEPLFVVTGKGGSLVRWHEPDDARVSRPESVRGSGEIPWAYSARAAVRPRLARCPVYPRKLPTCAATKVGSPGPEATFISRVYSGPLLMPHIAPQKSISQVMAEMVQRDPFICARPHSLRAQAQRCVGARRHRQGGCGRGSEGAD
jgi:DNA-binding transcriptional LysR family regulator